MLVLRRSRRKLHHRIQLRCIPLHHIPYEIEDRGTASWCVTSWIQRLCACGSQQLGRRRGAVVGNCHRWRSFNGSGAGR